MVRIYPFVIIEVVMSVWGYGTRPALECIKVEGCATKDGRSRYLVDSDGRYMDNGLIDGFWKSC